MTQTLAFDLAKPVSALRHVHVMAASRLRAASLALRLERCHERRDDLLRRNAL